MADTEPTTIEGPSFLPLAINMKGLRCLVVGGGRVGARKSLTLANAGAVVTVVSPSICARVSKAVDEDRVCWERSAYSREHLAGHSLVVAATDDPALNLQIGADAEAAGILSSLVSPGRASRVIFPASHRHGDLTVSVHSNGKECAQSRVVRDRIAALLRSDGLPSRLVAYGVRRADLPEATFRRLKAAGETLDAALGETFVLSTCNRWEVYFVSAAPKETRDRVASALGDALGHRAEELKIHFTHRYDAAAMHHLLRVSCGLDSTLRGETDIVAQIRTGVGNMPQRRSQVGELVSRVLQAQKRIRKQSGLYAARTNWATSAADLLQEALGGLHGRLITVVGYGRLGSALAALVQERGATVTAVSRRAGELSEVGVPVVPPDDLPRMARVSDAIVLTTDLSAAAGGAIGPRDGAVVLDLAGSNSQWFSDGWLYYGLERFADTTVTGIRAAEIAGAERLAFETAVRWWTEQQAPQTPTRTIRVGARGSRLSLAQVAELGASLRLVLGEAGITVSTFATPGDRDSSTPLSDAADDFFTRDLDEALLRGEIDMAVHSAKDLPMTLRSGLHVAAITPVFAPWECLVSREAAGFSELATGTFIGTSSVARARRLAELRPDVVAKGIRGDVPCRIVQLDEGRFDALILAAAGLIRLGEEGRIAQVFSDREFPPTPGQGALALVVRDEDNELRRLLGPLDLGDRSELPWA